MGKLKCKIEDAGDGEGYLFKTPWNPSFVRDIKNELPKFSREWQPGLRRWWVDALYLAEAVEIAARHYEIVGLPETTHDSAWDALWLVPGAPSEVVKAAYRALALLHHPDVGGNTRKMQRVNAAYEQLTEG